ncbi:MAG: HDIG domain-containing protein [Thermoplasmata archaeon]
MISREKAVNMVEEEVKNKNLRKHMLAVAAILKRLARELGEDEEKWEILGLVHDVDYEETQDSPEKHALVSAEMLVDKVPKEVVRAVKSHNHEHTGVEPISSMEHALIAADAASGLVIATALVMPSRKLEEARPESVIKKYGDSSFAKNIDRDRILHCEKLGLNRDEFLESSLEALQEIHHELGL